MKQMPMNRMNHVAIKTVYMYSEREDLRFREV